MWKAPALAANAAAQTAWAAYKRAKTGKGGEKWR